MSSSFFENLQSDGATPTGGEFLRAIAGVDRNDKVRAVKTSRDGSLLVSPSESLKAPFGRLRVTIPSPLFDSSQTYAKATLEILEKLVGSGSAPYSANEACTDMTVTTANGDRVVRQTKAYIPYQPGQGMVVFASAVFAAKKANLVQRIGYFDDDNGIFFEQDATNMKVVRRTKTSGSVVDTEVIQANWSMDTFDGNGESGLTLDATKVNAYIIDFGWLGSASVRFGVVYEGRIRYCHEMNFTSSLSTVWTAKPSLPIRWEIINSGATASGSVMKQICCSAYTEAGQTPLSLISCTDNGTSSRLIASGVSIPILALRLKTGFTRGVLFPMGFQIFNANPQPLYYNVTVGGAVSGGAWVNTTSVATEVNKTATTVIPGITIASGYISSSSKLTEAVLNSTLAATSDFDGTVADVVSIAVTNLASNGTASVYGSFTYRELYK